MLAVESNYHQLISQTSYNGILLYQSINSCTTAIVEQRDLYEGPHMCSTV